SNSRRWRGGRCRARAASAAVVATLHLGKELECLPYKAPNTPDHARPVKSGLVSLPVRQRYERLRDDPEPVRPASHWQLIYPVRRLEEAAPIDVASHRI